MIEMTLHNSYFESGSFIEKRKTLHIHDDKERSELHETKANNRTRETRGIMAYLRHVVWNWIMA